MSRFHILQHLPHETCGNIGRWLRHNGYAASYTRLDRGEQLPDATEFDTLIIMGGVMNIYQYRDHPWLLAERKWVEKFLGRGGKVLGICLGAQILADVLGARVHQNAEREIGWYPLSLTEAGWDSPLAVLPAAQPVLHWHGDNFDLPRGASLLASSAACPHQAFAYGQQIIGLQFHLEVGPGDIAAMMLDCQDDFRLSGPWIQSAQVIRQGAEQHAVAVEQVACRFLDRFLPVSVPVAT